MSTKLNPESFFRMKPVKFNSMLKVDKHITWGGSMVRTPNGKCYLFLSIWPQKVGFEGWAMHSKIGYAVADSPEDEFCFKGIIFEGSGEEGSWDRDVVHNPTIHYWNGKYYLYYTGNWGDGGFWSHRNNQRIGVAVAEHPEGPWKRFEQPLLDISSKSWDNLLTTNPSITRMMDGRYILVYKSVGAENPPPMCGPILHGVAFSDSPAGSFKKHPEPIFSAKNVNFPGEDPFIFTYKNKLYTIIKDIENSYYDQEKRALVLFESENGIDWKLAEKPLVISRKITWENGNIEEMFRLERPQLYIENGIPRKLFAGVKPNDNQDMAFNIHLNVEFDP